LGDTVVALPSLHLIARAFPDAERALLSNLPVNAKSPAAAAVLGSSGLVHRFFSYPLATRAPGVLCALLREVRAWGPDVLIYLSPYRSAFRVFRDAVFFASCGVHRIVGLPYGGRARPAFDCKSGYWEGEWHRLLRCINELGQIDAKDPGSWDLHLSETELRAGHQAMEALGDIPYVACSTGTKVDVNDWGDRNWAALVRRLPELLAGYGLVAVGATVEKQRSEGLLGGWRGPRLNLCGALDVRVSAAVLSRAALFIGHDSGPMHVAAAGGTPCVAIFSARNPPGWWFPFGHHHRILYHRTECFGCRLQTCVERAKDCIRSITVDEVLAAVAAIIGYHGKH
jgi:hypothetical protein